MAIAVNNVVPLRRTRASRASQAGPASPQVYVIFTTAEDTLMAARTANELARSMGAGVSVLHFRPVSYAVPLESSVGASLAAGDAFTDQLTEEGISAIVRVWLCRSERDAAAVAIPPHSLVVVGGHRGWWPTRASRWVRTLEKLDHCVVSGKTLGGFFCHRTPQKNPPRVFVEEEKARA